MTTNPDRTSHHDIRVHFEEELDALRQETVRLGAMVLENTKRLSDAVLENRLELAREVVDGDREIDELYSALERRAYLIIATQQPVAGDLRFLISMTRILYELERSGDLAVNCAQGLLHHDGYELPSQLKSVLARLFAATTEIFGKGLDALADMDPTSGVWLDEEDDVVDELTAEFYRHIVGEKGRIEDVDLAVELSRTGRYLERIADHSVNVGEHVTFTITGSFPNDRESAATGDEG
jgi:phosphate transport system protein